MLLTDNLDSSTAQFFYVIMICRLEGLKYGNITQLKLVRCVREKATKNDVVVMTKLQHFKGFM